MAAEAKRRVATVRQELAGARRALAATSRDEIVPTYRIAALVRASQGLVDPIGIEPTTSSMPWKRSTY